MEHKPEILKSAAVALGVVALFFVVYILAHQYEQEIGSFIRAGGAIGPVFVVLLTAFCLVFMIPLDISVLIPLSITAWGSLATALLSVAGWTLGSCVSFYLARHYGRPFVERAIGARRIAQAEGHAPKHHLFWWVVGTQALVQVDFISYMFGLFTRIPIAEYALATAIGDILPAFYLSYAYALPFWYGIAAVAAGLAVTALLFWRFTRRAID